MKATLFVVSLTLTLSFPTSFQTLDAQRQSGTVTQSSTPAQTEQDEAAIRPVTAQSTVSSEETVAHTIPNGKLVEVPGASHVVPLANPVGFSAVARGFLESGSVPVSGKEVIDPDLKKAIAARADAERNRDIETFSRMTADDFTLTNEMGEVITKQERIERLNTGQRQAQAQSDVQTRFYGDAALRTRHIVLDGKPARMLTVWVEQNGQRKVAATQITAELAMQQSTPAARPRVEADCNAAARSPLPTVPLPGHPFSIVPTRDGCWLFISLTSDDPKANGVAVLRREAGTISLQRVYPIEARKGRDAMRPGPSGMVMTHDGQLLIVANDDGLIFLDVPSMISGKSAAVIGHFSDGAPKHTVVTSNEVTETSAGSFYVNITRDDARLFVSDEYAGTISVIDLQKARLSNYDSSAVVGRIPVGVAPIALTFSPDERWLYTTSHDASPSWNWPLACPQDRADRAAYTKLEKPEGAVVIVDVARARTDPAHAVAAKVPAGCGPVRLAITPDGGSIWVSARRGDAVLGFDTGKLVNDPPHARLGLVPVGTAPVGIAVLPDGKHIVVANSNRIAANPNSPQTIGVIDIEKVRAGAPAVIGTFPAGAFPREFSPSPDGRMLFLGNFLSNTLEVVDVNSLFDILQTSDRKPAGEAAAQPTPNPESEAEARKVIDAFSEAGNKRDLEGLRNALNFPYIRIAGGKVSIARTREEFTSDAPPQWRDEGWHHSRIDSVEFIQSSSDKVHAAVVFSRYKADGTRYATYRTLRIITRQNGHWGIQCNSSFAP